jgi:AAHS family 4-hydroxybenzoate transporter-like MFS transporter
VKQATVFDVRQFIDEQPFSRYQLLIAVICGVVVFFDGFDAQVMGYVAPVLRVQLGIAPSAIGWVSSSGLFGMMIGGLVFGPLADRFGRRPILLACTITFGLGSLLTATATSVATLVICRLLTGFGMGGAMPNTIALTSEFTPKKYRATAVMTMFCGFSIGAAVCGFVAAGIVSRLGWQSVFVVGGVFPCLVAVVLYAFLPESIRFLLVKGGEQRRVGQYLSRIAPSVRIPAEMSIGDEEHRSGAFVVKQLFTQSRGRVTLLLWVMFFMNLLDLYFISNWLPTVIHDIGIKVEVAIIITSLFQVGGIVGSLVLGRLLDRYLSFGVLALTYLAAGLFVVLIGEVGASVPLLVGTVLAAGFGIIGGQTCSNALAAEFYPTAIRSTGVGWALGIGRVGSIIGPILGGELLLLAGGARRVFSAAAVPPLIATIAALSAAIMKPKGTRI